MTPDRCPSCDADLRGDPIPEHHRHLYGDSTHYLRTIGIYDRDRTVEWMCPDCGHRWPR